MKMHTQQGKGHHRAEHEVPLYVCVCVCVCMYHLWVSVATTIVRGGLVQNMDSGLMDWTVD